MALKEMFSRLFGYNNRPQDIKQPLPQVHLLGYEKSQGTPHPEDFNLMIKNYKSWAYACANKNGFSVAKCKLRLYTGDPEGDNYTEVKKHPFIDLINSVNPFSNKFELISLTQIYLELTGNAYWWIPRNDLRIPYMIWSIPSHWMSIVPSKNHFIDGYVMQVPGKGEKVPFDAEEIVHFKFPSPLNLFYGYSPLYAAMYGVDLNNETKKWGINFFLNNAQPSGVLYTESSLHGDQYQRLKDSWNRKYRGSENAGKIAILESGLKYQQIGSTIKDSKFDDVSREIRDEILAMFGVPASKLGLVEDVNRANAETNDYTYQKETILPRLALLEEKLNEKMMPIYDKGLFVKFDNPVPEDKEYRLREKQINIQSGFASIDEEREKEGLDPFNLPETSVPLIPFSLTPAGEERPEPTYTNPKEEEKEEKSFGLTKSKRDRKWELFAASTAPIERLFGESLQRYFQAQHSEAMKNLNGFKSIDGVVNKDLSAYVLFNMKQANEKLKDYARAHIKNAIITGLTLGMNDTGTTINFNLYEPNIIKSLEIRLGFFVEKVNQSTADMIKEELIASVEKGESIAETAKRIDGIFGYSEKFRSKRIAQTEIIGATNDGQLKAYQEAGFESKEWLTARDEKVRDSHQIDGQTVKITQSFKTNLGTHLNYPGDRSSGAPAEEVINCRCTVLPSRKKE